MMAVMAVAMTLVQAGPVITAHPGRPDGMPSLSRMVPPDGGDWRALWLEADGVSAIDVAHVVKTGDDRDFWVARLMAKDGIPAPTYVLVHMQIDCAAAVAQTLWVNVHGPDGALEVGFAPEADPAPFSPSSNGAAMAGVVCGDGVQPDTAGFSSHSAFIDWARDQDYASIPATQANDQ